MITRVVCKKKKTKRLSLEPSQRMLNLSNRVEKTKKDVEQLVLVPTYTNRNEIDYLSYRAISMTLRRFPQWR